MGTRSLNTLLFYYIMEENNLHFFVLAVFMDVNCGGQARNDDMSEGDFYYIEAESNHDSGKMPAECSQSFDFGDRFIASRVIHWACEFKTDDIFMSFYDNCYGQRQNILVWIAKSPTLRIGLPSLMPAFFFAPKNIF